MRPQNVVPMTQNGTLDARAKEMVPERLVLRGGYKTGGADGKRLPLNDGSGGAHVNKLFAPCG
jgi:hypothetical protein